MSTQVEAITAIAHDDLPPGWRMSTIGELLKVRNGFAFKSTDYREDGALLIRQSNLDGSRVTVEKAKYLPKSYLKQYRDFQIKKGDILIGMSGSIGKLCTYDLDEPALQNQRTGLLVFKDPEQKPWVWHYLPLLEKELVRVGKGVAVQNVSASQIESFPIPVAPLDQQKRIVAEIEKQFSRLDEAVANLKRVRANLKRYKAAVLKAAVEGRLVETEAELARREGRSFETGAQLLQRILETRRSQWQGKGKYKEPAAADTTDLPELPEGWVWTNCDAVLLRIEAGASFKCIERPPVGDETGVLKVSAVTWGEFDELESKTCVDPERIEESYLVQGGDFLFSRANTIDLVGACVIAKEVSMRLMLSDKTLRFRISSLVSVHWLLTCLRSKWGRLEIERLATGNQESMRNIGQDRIRQIRIPLPPLAEQSRIVLEIDRRFTSSTEVEKQVKQNSIRANRLGMAILSKAFHKHDVPSPL